MAETDGHSDRRAVGVAEQRLKVASSFSGEEDMNIGMKCSVNSGEFLASALIGRYVSESIRCTEIPE